jgi:hypothetical protein
MSKWRLVIRHGSQVKHEEFEDLDAAVEAMEDRVRDVRREGPLPEVSAIREYEPRQRVHARLELSSGGVFRGREAGLDVMGDGALVPYVGVVRKRRLDPGDGQSPFDAIRAALT